MKLQGPKNNGGFSHEGTSYEPDADGCIDVPPEVTGFALSHGFSFIATASADEKVDFSKLNKKQLLAFGKDTLELDLDASLTNKELISQIETALEAKEAGAE